MKRNSQGNIIQLDAKDFINHGYEIQTIQAAETPIYKPLNEKKSLFGKTKNTPIEAYTDNLIRNQKAPYRFDFKNKTVSGGSRGYDKISFSLLSDTIEVGKPIQFIVNHRDGSHDFVTTANVNLDGIKEFDLSRDERDLSQYEKPAYIYTPER